MAKKTRRFRGFATDAIFCIRLCMDTSSSFVPRTSRHFKILLNSAASRGSVYRFRAKDNSGVARDRLSA